MLKKPNSKLSEEQLKVINMWLALSNDDDDEENEDDV